MEKNNDSSADEVLSQKIIQKLVAKALLDVKAGSTKYFDLFTGGEDEHATLAELAISAISKLRAVEIIILTTLRTMMKDNNIPDGAVKFLNYLCKDITAVLMLLNNITSVEDLVAVYEEEDLENTMRAYKDGPSTDSVESSNINDLTKDLGDLLSMARESAHPQD